jgi:uncharacterized protein (TIGR03437 family)
MSKLLCRVALALATTGFICGQQLPFPTYLNPVSLFVGSGPASISVFNQSYQGTLTALWNGSPRPTTTTPGGSYSVALTAADLAAPQLAQITMVNASGAIVDTVYCPVGFNVQPTGVAYDSSRNQLYIATPAKPGDSRLPPNAVVALNVDSETIGPVLPIGVVLGDLALSDDASALYVVIEGSNVVRRINPSTFTAVGDFSFRTGTAATAGAADTITVMPGSPGTVALEFFPQPGDSGAQIAIFDNGVRRPNAPNVSCCTGMLFSPDEKYLFENGTTTFQNGPGAFDYQDATFRYSIDSTGIPTQTPLSALGTAPVAIEGGTLYTMYATAINYQTMQTTGNFGIGGPVAIDAPNQRALILYSPPDLDDEGSHFPVELAAFALPSLEPLGTQNVGVSSIPSLNATEQLIRFGADGVIVPSTNGLLMFHTPVAGPAPATASNAVVNAASQSSGSLAPGEIVTIYGTNLGPATAQGATPSAGVFPSSLAGIQVWFGSLSGTPLVANQGQINVVAPFELQPGAAVNLQVWNYGIPSAQVSLPVVTAAPGFFTQNGSGTGPIALINQDGTIDTPAPAGSVVTLYGTGAGALPGAVDGAEAAGAANLAAAVQVLIAGLNAPVLYAGAAPGLVNGVFQINVQVPGSTPSGAASITINIGGQASPLGATLAIR